MKKSKSKTPSMASPISTTMKVKRKDSINSPLSRNGSPTSLTKRQNSCYSTSPYEKMNLSILDFKRIVYITQ